MHKGFIYRYIYCIYIFIHIPYKYIYTYIVYGILQITFISISPNLVSTKPKILYSKGLKFLFMCMFSQVTGGKKRGDEEKCNRGHTGLL